MSSAVHARLKYYIDPSSPSATFPPGHNEPGFEGAFAEARLFVTVAYAGASKRVLHRVVKSLSPQSRAIVRWMVREIKAARLTPGV